MGSTSSNEVGSSKGLLLREANLNRRRIGERQATSSGRSHLQCSHLYANCLSSPRPSMRSPRMTYPNNITPGRASLSRYGQCAATQQHDGAGRSHSISSPRSTSLATPEYQRAIRRAVGRPHDASSRRPVQTEAEVLTHTRLCWAGSPKSRFTRPLSPLAEFTNSSRPSTSLFGGTRSEKSVHSVESVVGKATRRRRASMKPAVIQALHLLSADEVENRADIINSEIASFGRILARFDHSLTMETIRVAAFELFDLCEASRRCVAKQERRERRILCYWMSESYEDVQLAYKLRCAQSRFAMRSYQDTSRNGESPISPTLTTHHMDFRPRSPSHTRSVSHNNGTPSVSSPEPRRPYSRDTAFGHSGTARPAAVGTPSTRHHKRNPMMASYEVRRPGSVDAAHQSTSHQLQYSPAPIGGRGAGEYVHNNDGGPHRGQCGNRHARVHQSSAAPRRSLSCAGSGDQPGCYATSEVRHIIAPNCNSFLPNGRTEEEALEHKMRRQRLLLFDKGPLFASNGDTKDIAVRRPPPLPDSLQDTRNHICKTGTPRCDLESFFRGHHSLERHECRSQNLLRPEDSAPFDDRSRERVASIRDASEHSMLERLVSLRCAST